MTVIYKNQLYGLDFDYQLFQNLKSTNPFMTVKISSLNDSTYSKEEEVELHDLEDWSVVRNINALGRN